ncbi:hybrid non-ribosomal peptide synthetase/type I polyketide synthase [Corallococcus macrosporus]|uniref:Phenolphthiocerol/phthiocerol polyketide synthase subunit E n=1 Tax=Myxococcus fulvus (strain ATCC BAA-855 / HW-1) TaxID=483219 RepID=F8CHL5_MYXFH|nr:hybrid non-ribosomal peptide synthetase/type I polyketide synthase [Corallococcus macrosporus]AEI67516.1 non-ribosomal peptide synthase/polyketide synthase [Corallococcus macrosporus]
MAEHDTLSENSGGTGNDIAIIGMAGRFPGSADVQSFWRNLREGVESIVRLAPEALEWSPLMAEASRHHPDFVPVAAEMEGGDGFDAAFFGMAPREAEWMDPQQRVFLECAWTALEDAALDPERFEGKIALYAGASASMHGLGRVGQGNLDPASLYELMSNTAENLATRASFKLGLRGESLSLYTACSTGLVAVHMACQSLVMRQSDVALAGAVRLAMPQRTGYLFQEGMILSPDGHCRAFDARAAGTVPGNGVAVVVLKPLEDARRDGDRVYAVIRGSSINNDGGQKVGYTAPSVEGQADVIGEALAFAGLEAGDIGYVEAHGTGTALGDPIEVAALTRAYRRQTEQKGYCALGSVKTNVGHLDTAAGLAGLIKTALALTHEELPPTLHFERPNPAIDFANSPFFVVDRLRPWPRGPVPRRAGVSSFGIGGTNAHAVLEEAPLPEPTTPSVRPTQVVTLSGRSPEALDAAARELAGWLDAAPADVALADVAFTRNVGRRAFEHRRSFVAPDVAALREKLRAPGKAQAVENVVAAREQGVAFLFPGQGAQSVGMGHELHAAEPVYREALESCLDGLGATLGAAVRGVLSPAPGAEDAAKQALADPGIALPALFAVEYALARQWEAWGVRPRAYLGHSFGEYVAACLAEVLPLEDALALVAARGRLMARMPPGSMTAVGCAEETVRPLLTEALSLAAVNGPDRCVVSGPTPDVEALERDLAVRGIGVLRLPAAHAFHSAAVEPLMAELRRVVAGLRLAAPQRPYVSSVTGTWIRAEEATDPDYWLRQMRAPVRFGDGLEALRADGCTVFLEVGPDQALTALARGGPGRAVASQPRTGSKRGMHATLMEALGALWEQGLVLDWHQVYAHEARRKLSLPTYPFQRQTFRVAAPAPVKALQAPAEVVAVSPVVADGGGAAEAASDLAGARTEVERKVLAIWRERLGRSDFGIHDDFLELGGNSLMAAQLLTRLREAFPVPLPLSDVFDSPTVAGISARIQERLGASGANGAEPVLPPLVRIPRDGDLPLSVVQGRVCALEQALPGNPALNMYVVLRFQGALDVAVLERSLEAAAQRHEALRTSYPLQDGVPVLRIAPRLTFPLTPEPLAGATWQQRVYDEVSRPFDLERGPVARARLWRLDADDFMLAVTIHHVVCDTWSLVVFAKELGEHYAALKQGHPARLPALPVQYVDFAAWQRKALKEGAFASQIAAWRERLAAFPSPLELPVDRARGDGPALRGQVLKVGFSATLSAAVQALAQREGVTPFMVLLASWKALLSRWTGRDDIVVGTPIGNRSRPELEPMIGYVAHAVPLRTDMAGAPSFRELVMRVRDVIMEAYAHPDVPYEELGREIEPTKDTGRSRVFDTLFVLHSRFDRTVDLPGVRMSLAELDDVPPEFGSVLSDLTVGLGEHAHGFSGTIDYADERFERDTVERLVAHWTTLLEAAVAAPETPLLALPLEQPRPGPVAVEAGRSASAPVPVAAALQARAAADAASVAMTAPDGRAVTWGELRASADRLAAELAGHEVGPEVLVAVCVEPSVERVVAQWAVQALGAAYVLLSVPQLRELASLSPPGAPSPLLLTHTNVRTGVPLDAARVIRVDEVLSRTDSRLSVPAREAPRASDGDMVCLEPLVGSRGEQLRAIHTHHTVAALFARLDAEAPSKDGIWLAAEEAQAPGSGLELLWALTRGLRVVLPAERARFTSWGTGAAAERRRTDFSLSFFANDEDSLGGRKYRLLLEAAKFADAHGFSAVWTPERHFHSFGGLYPRPAVVGAGVATVTERLGIRAGSVVLPLHDPILVAEEWAVLDNLSDGRVGVSFASGWHANDFVFAPDRYARRKDVLHRGIEEVRTLWRGGTVLRRNGAGEEVAISLRPKPVQKVLPIWLTAAGSPETFRLAGELGAYVLTNLMGQHLDDLASKVALYRDAWRQHGHAGRGHVSLMMHAFLGDDPAEVQKKARPPLLDYFRSSVDISSGFLASLGLDVDPRSLSRSDIDALLAHGVERYVQDGGLIGTPESCAPMVERVQRLDVDEIACLVDFGVEVEATLEGLRHLDALRGRHSPAPSPAIPSAALREGPGAAEALLSLVREAGITHLHCTAALARSMLALPDAAEVLRPVRHVLLEGASEEAAASLARAMPWRVAHRQPGLGLGAWAVAMGPVDASRWDVVDGRGQPVPVGVVGELVVTGAGVPRGFWNAPETTSMRVLAGDSDGARRLGTGRRARRKRDGSVELLAAAPVTERRPAPPKSAARMGSGAASRPEGSGTIPLVPRGRPLPLSFAQQRLWYLDRLEPGNVAYNNAVAFTLSGKLDAAALERALNGVVRRHEALRTTFAVEGDAAVQLIAPALEVSILVRDAEDASEEELARQAREEARRTFDLEQGPLLRATLLRVGSTEHVLLLTLHHIISDGWSAAVMVHEMIQLYESEMSGQPPTLPALSVQYADYALWQLEWMRGPSLKAEQDWWGEVLAEVPVLQLPVDRPRPPVQTHDGAQLPFSVPRSLMDAVVAAGRKEGATPFMVLLAAWQVLLHAYTGQEDFAVGSPVAGRNRPEVEPLIGCFINSIALRADLSGDPTFTQVLGRVRRTALAAFSHQEMPFEKVLEVLNTPRDLSHNPVFQTMLVLHNTPTPVLSLAGLQMRGRYVHTGATKMDLTLEVTETAEGLRGGIDFNTRLFDEATIARLAGSLLRVLEAAASRPDARLSQLDLLDAAERARLLVEWNPAPVAELPASDTVPARFLAQAARTPDAVAVADGARTFTYRELEALSLRVAGHLVSRGVGRGAVVALAVAQPSEVVAGLLGVMRAGAAVVVLDVDHPPERLSSILADTQARMLLTSESLRARVPSRAGPEVITLDSLPEATGGLRVRPEGTDAACIVYTSGSTGRPRGVVLEHRHLVAATRARAEVYGAPGVVMSLAPFTFDAALAGLLWSLFEGGALRYPDAEEREDPRRLAERIAQSRVTHLISVPSLYGQLLAAAAVGGLKSLTAVSVGGEACPVELTRAHHEALPSVALFNEYGPTEATIWSTVHRVRVGEEHRVPIGRAVPGARVYLLDARRKLVPQGAPGEVYLGGAGVARGYLGQPGLTAERFVTDPFDGRSGARMYRTGDVARWRGDGTLEFLGRVDEQVKVRGFRIEPGEVEATLLANPSVREAVVVARDDGKGPKRLVAYVVPVATDSGAAPDAAALKGWVRSRLPPYMVPAAVVALDALPRTRHGKVDRRALPAPETGPAVAPVAPRSEVEATLVSLWREVLGVERVGIHDDFFELGGDSILGLQIITRARAQGIELSPKQLFQNPTVARLATVAGTRLAVQAEQGAVVGPVALTPIQHWFFELAQEAPHHWNMSLLLEVKTPLDGALLGQALTHLLAHHDALRARFARGDAGWRQVVPEPEAGVLVEQVDLSTVPEVEQAAVLQHRAEEAQQALRLDGGLLHATLLTLGRGRSARLLLTVHHLVVDAVSWRILLEDLAGVYAQLAAGNAARLPPKTTSFQAWARGLETLARSEKLAAERKWWLERPWQEAARVPVDFPEGVNTEATAHSVRVTLDVEETRALLQDVPKAWHTQAQDPLLTALGQALTAWAGGGVALVDVEGHGREEVLPGVDVSRTVGWFTRVFPALLDLRGAPTPGDALRAVKEGLRAVPSQGMGWGLLRYVSKDAALAALPAAEVGFNHLGQVDGVVGADGPFALAAESESLRQRAPVARRPYLIDVMSAVRNGRLEVLWTFSGAVHRRETVARVAEDFVTRLRALVAASKAPDAGGHSPSDFPLAKVKQAQLDKLSARFGKKTR